jgi:hypothetical protein
VTVIWMMVKVRPASEIALMVYDFWPLLALGVPVIALRRRQRRDTGERGAKANAWRQGRCSPSLAVEIQASRQAYEAQNTTARGQWSERKAGTEQHSETDQERGRTGWQSAAPSWSRP